jgi:hypothetical protein
LPLSLVQDPDDAFLAELPSRALALSKWIRRQRAWLFKLLSFKDHALATFQEARLFTYLEHLTGDHQFRRGCVILDSLWTRSRDHLTKSMEFEPSFDERAIRQRYWRLMHPARGHGAPKIALIDPGEPVIPLIQYLRREIRADILSR